MTAPDTNTLLAKLNANPDLSDIEKAYLREQLTSKKKYGLIWEEKPEAVEQQLLTNLPVLTEVPERRVVAQPLNRSTAQPLNRSTAQPLNKIKPSKLRLI